MSEERISRRRMLKRIGAGAVVAWSAPVITSVTSPAFAQYQDCDCSDPCVECVEGCRCDQTTESDCGCFSPECLSPCTSSADCGSGQRCVVKCGCDNMCAALCGPDPCTLEEGCPFENYQPCRGNPPGCLSGPCYGSLGCFKIENTEGRCRCAQNAFCSCLDRCSSSSDCPKDQFCVTNTGCGPDGICLDCCGKNCRAPSLGGRPRGAKVKN